MITDVVLDDPAKRNALSTAMFDSINLQLDAANEASVIRLRATGTAFCAGFDLAACVDDLSMLSVFLQRLGELTARLRSHPAIVVAEVNGAAIAGGCALVCAADLVSASPAATFGYPVHAIGISPAVSLPMLLERLTPGDARALVLSGEIIDANRAVAIGLVDRLEEDLATRVSSFAAPELLAVKAFFPPPETKAATEASINTATTHEARTMLRAFWSNRSNRSKRSKQS